MASYWKNNSHWNKKLENNGYIYWDISIGMMCGGPLCTILFWWFRFITRFRRRTCTACRTTRTAHTDLHTIYTERPAERAMPHLFGWYIRRVGVFFPIIFFILIHTPAVLCTTLLLLLLLLLRRTDGQVHYTTVYRRFRAGDRFFHDIQGRPRSVTIFTYTAGDRVQPAARARAAMGLINIYIIYIYL